MSPSNSLQPTPKITPTLDPTFRPAVLANRAFQAAARQCPDAAEVHLGLEQADGSLVRCSTTVFPEGHAEAATNFGHVERLVKFLLWARGGFRVHYSGPIQLGEALNRHFKESATGKFDAQIMGERIYEHPFEVKQAGAIPEARSATTPLGRHLDGCRIGFDLGGSDRKIAAVIDGKCVYSEEIVWNPIPQTDPQWHFDQVMESLRLAASHLPRVDAIGGSSAGVIVNSRVKVASLFRGVPIDLFNSRVKDLFLEMKRAWGNIPFEVANDGEVTALAGSMSMGQNGVLGIAMGTSLAGGYVNPEGNITSWLNELAFAPIDARPDAPVDEWSGDRGCGVQYFSQQAVGRLLPAAGIELPTELSLPEKLKAVQELMAADDPRALSIYKTIGTYLGYGLAHYSDFYDFQHLLILGRVTSGSGGDILLAGARAVLDAEFPELAEKIRFHTPNETDKRHGQAVAAASLPAIPH